LDIPVASDGVESEVGFPGAGCGLDDAFEFSGSPFFEGFFLPFPVIFAAGEFNLRGLDEAFVWSFRFGRFRAMWFRSR